MGVLAVPFFLGDPMPGLRIPGADAELDTPPSGDTPQQRMAGLYCRVADWVAGDDTPVVFGGDCLLAIGVLAGLQRKDLDPTVVWFDAHGDFHTWETTRSGFLGGMPLAMLVGRGEQTIVVGAGLKPVAEDSVVLVGARDLDPGEDRAVAGSRLRLVSVARLAHSPPPSGPLHLHLDVDIVDPGEIPAVNYPAPGGPSAAEVRRAIIHLAATGQVAAVSVSSWNPQLPEAARSAEASLKLVSPFLTTGTGSGASRPEALG